MYCPGLPVKNETAGSCLLHGSTYLHMYQHMAAKGHWVISESWRTFAARFSFSGPVVQWIVRKSPELDIPVRFWAGLQQSINWLYNQPVDTFFIGRNANLCRALISRRLTNTVRSASSPVRVPTVYAATTAAACCIQKRADKYTAAFTEKKATSRAGR